MRKEINDKIRTYWVQQVRSEVDRTPIRKKKVPSFTRHNGRKILALKRKDHWRKRKGLHSTRLLGPKIGYKNPESFRFRKKNGLLLTVVHNLIQLKTRNLIRKPYEVFVIARTVGGKKRLQILNQALKHKYPLYITK